MSYVARVLQPGESVVQIAHLHWVMYTRPILAFVVAIAIAIGGSTLVSDQRIVAYLVAALMIVIGLLSWTSVWFRRWTTEIAVTDRRIIYKTGFIRRDTREMNIHRVETVNVDQSILGRMLNYGTLTVRGTGAGIENVPAVADPLRVRSAVTAPTVS